MMKKRGGTTNNNEGDGEGEINEVSTVINGEENFLNVPQNNPNQNNANQNNANQNIANQNNADQNNANQNNANQNNANQNIANQNNANQNNANKNNANQKGGKKKTRARARKVNKSVSPIRRPMMKKRGGNLDEHLNNVKSTLGGLINQLH
jgi:hypothetical protein